MGMELLSVNQVAEWLGLGRSATYALVASKKLVCYRLGPNGGRLKFKVIDLEAYAESCRVGPKPPAPPRYPRAKYDHGY